MSANSRFAILGISQSRQSNTLFPLKVKRLVLPAHDIPVAIPRIETGRLVLRGHRADDLQDCARMWGDRDVTRYIGGKPFSREEVWSKILRYAGHWSLLGFGYWVIADRASGRFLGEAGFADFKRRIEQELHRFERFQLAE